jgi:hypothetical protein
LDAEPFDATTTTTTTTMFKVPVGRFYFVVSKF